MTEAAESDPLVGRVLAGRFEIRDRLGAGGFGAVYRARQISMDRLVALKVLRAELTADSNAVRRFQREMKATAKLEHPNVVRVYDYGRTDDGVCFLAMELVDGETLSTALKASGPMDGARVVHIGRQIAEALHAAHAEGIVHRDLKPPNIILSNRYGKRDQVKVLDFGIARCLEAEPGEETEALTGTGMLIGTPQYMSPEQAQSAKVDHRSDLYALGVVLYQMATGRAPFTGRTPLEVMFSHVHDAPTPPCVVTPGRVAPGLEAVILKLLEKDPGARPASAAEVIRLLDGLDATAPAQQGTVHLGAMPQSDEVEAPSWAPAPSPRRAPEPAPARAAPPRWGLWIGVAVGALSLGVIAWFALGRQAPTTTAAPTPPSAAAPTAQAEVPKATPRAGRPPERPIPRPAAALAMAPPPRPVAGAARPPAREPPEGMAAIEGGTIALGCREGDARCYDDERPAHEVQVAAFALQRHEVAMEDYDECVARAACPAPGRDKGCTWQQPGLERHPITCVDWAGAKAYCAFRGWRLPTEAEWEAAARRGAGADWPWGAEAPTCALTVMASAEGSGCGLGTPQPVGSRPADRTRDGVEDLGGNVREWVDTDYGPYPGAAGDPKTTGKVNRGGSWSMTAAELATLHTRGVDAPTERRPDLGFRCARGL